MGRIDEFEMVYCALSQYNVVIPIDCTSGPKGTVPKVSVQCLTFVNITPQQPAKGEM
jgi:hypothetical protein